MLLETCCWQPCCSVLLHVGPCMKEDIVCTLIVYLSDGVEEQQILDCQFAEHYYKERNHSVKEKKNYSRNQKIRCKAH